VEGKPESERTNARSSSVAPLGFEMGISEERPQNLEPERIDGLREAKQNLAGVIVCKRII
jgi:hypothetical protein